MVEVFLISILAKLNQKIDKLSNNEYGEEACSCCSVEGDIEDIDLVVLQFDAQVTAAHEIGAVVDEKA